MKVGFIGLGNMGEPMARNIYEAGIDIAIYNRTRSKAQALEQEGISFVESPKALAEQVDILITMLSDDAAVRSILTDGGVIDALPPDGIHICMSTISVALARELKQWHADRDQHYISAPVFGRPDMAEEGNLWVVAAGNSVVIEKVAPIFDAIGRELSVVGEQPFNANLVKVSGNFMIASMIEALGESFALIEKAGMDKHEFLDIMTGSLFGAPIYKNYGSLIADEKYSPAGFKMKHGLKDVNLVLDAAEEWQVPMPLANVTHDHYISGVAKKWENLDWAALAKVIAYQAGIDE